MKSSYIVFTILLFMFFFFELAFAFVINESHPEYLMTSGVKSIVLVLAIALYSQRMMFAKTTLTVLLLINGLACISLGISEGYLLYFSIGAFSIFFAICIQRLKLLRGHYDAPKKGSGHQFLLK